MVEKITTGDIIKMYSMRKDGFTYEDIGNRFGITRQWVEKILKGSINVKRINYKTKYPNHKKVVNFMLENDFSIAELADKIGIGYQTLRNFLADKIKGNRAEDISNKLESYIKNYKKINRNNYDNEGKICC